MASYPAVTGKQAVKVLLRLGFEEKAIRGSHHMLWKEGRSIIVVPVHGNRVLPAGTLKSILKQAGLKAADFFKAL
ncbi:MAG: type II toxin-antitoxin system HicA family toxin [Bryobacteraceae bacterium]|nr:type II toxin-antitoxin system HicA family toxin [Bryobacterales bacterium]MEB2361268.1 type II toxin-antitoxin system HicA family toxin [Bryobacterales bacterium]NUN03538.1 type II toxin-antitoxin system HicA family toxin [Bryobacteraceae bacterium]